MSSAMTRRSFVSLALLSPLGLAACSGGGSAAGSTSAATSSASETTNSTEATSAGSADASAADATSAAATDKLAPGTMENGVLVSPLDNGFDSGTHHATIQIKDYGTIKVELNASVAPITVSNFADLAQSGFYDGLTFHRIIEGFMIQGGDPNGDGTGGSDRNIKGEFFANGVVNAIQHKRGVISMARANDPDSASSQFFIMHQDYPSLNEQYAAFGHVTEGIEVVDAIATSVPVEDGNGSVAKENQPVIESIRMDD